MIEDATHKWLDMVMQRLDHSMVEIRAFIRDYDNRKDHVLPVEQLRRAATDCAVASHVLEAIANSTLGRIYRAGAGEGPAKACSRCGRWEPGECKLIKDQREKCVLGTKEFFIPREEGRVG